MTSCDRLVCYLTRGSQPPRGCLLSNTSSLSGIVSTHSGLNTCVLRQTQCQNSSFLSDEMKNVFKEERKSSYFLLNTPTQSWFYLYCQKYVSLLYKCAVKLLFSMNQLRQVQKRLSLRSSEEKKVTGGKLTPVSSVKKVFLLYLYLLLMFLCHYLHSLCEIRGHFY